MPRFCDQSPAGKAFARRVTLLLAAAFLLPLEAKKKTAGKNSQPFQEESAAKALSPTKLLQPCLTALQLGSHSFY
jgi:hypothetical protein